MDNFSFNTDNVFIDVANISLSKPATNASKEQKIDLNFLSKYYYYVPDAITYKVVDQPIQLVNEYQPTEYDVLCGRGKGSYDKPGNKRFRVVIKSYINAYENTKTKMGKSLILDEIIDKVQEQNNGSARFLKYDSSTKCWNTMTNEQAREKVGHVVREAVATYNKSK